jgi:hypothetical protein
MRAPHISVEVQRYLAALPVFQEIISDADAAQQGCLGLHDFTLRLGSTIPFRYALCSGLELTRDPSLEAVSHRLLSMARFINGLAHGVGAVDEVIIGKLRQWPEFLRQDIERALLSRGVES